MRGSCGNVQRAGGRREPWLALQCPLWTRALEPALVSHPYEQLRHLCRLQAEGDAKAVRPHSVRASIPAGSTARRGPCPGAAEGSARPERRFGRSAVPAGGGRAGRARPPPSGARPLLPPSAEAREGAAGGAPPGRPCGGCGWAGGGGVGAPRRGTEGCLRLPGAFAAPRPLLLSAACGTEAFSTGTAFPLAFAFCEGCE